MTLKEKLALLLAQARKAYEDGNVEEGDKLKMEAETIQKALASLGELDKIEDGAKAALIRPSLPGVGDGADAGSQKANEKPQETREDSPAVKAVYALRFGDEDAKKEAVFTDLVGRNYKSTLLDQHKAFAKYLRAGDRLLDRDEWKLLNTQIFAFEDIKSMVRNGYGVAEIKATMVEAQGSLGGFAVPPTMQSEILQRLPGLTAVRGGGAMVVNLTTGNSTEFVEITGGDSRYTSGLRGAWGSETQNPTEKNLTLGLRQVNADVYTYKAPMSQSLVEDAGNLVGILQDEAVMTFALDEDEAFLIGDGAGKPLGLLPGGLNPLGISEVNSGNATALAANGIRALKRGVASQYRGQATWVGNSDTYGEIERMIDGQGQYLFPDLSDEDQLLARRIYESEAMADVAANAYPLLFGWMRGYGIVERSGMTIARFQDSNTGINKVEFQFRRRIGGRPLRLYYFAVQKVAAA